MMAYLILILMAPAYNSFAYDGKGIQTFFHLAGELSRSFSWKESPASRHAHV